MQSSHPLRRVFRSNKRLIVVVQSLSHVQLFATPWTPAHQASLSFTISWSLLRFMSTESVQWRYITISSSATPFFCLQSFPASGSFLMNGLFTSGGQSLKASASASILYEYSGLTGLISLQSKGLSRVFSHTTIQRHQLFSAQPSLWSSSHIHIQLLEKP